MSEKWKSTKNPPEYSGEFLICTRQFGFSGPYMDVASYNHLEKSWFITNHAYGKFDIDYWMELPEPPKDWKKNVGLTGDLR